MGCAAVTRYFMVLPNLHAGPQLSQGEGRGGRVCGRHRVSELMTLCLKDK